LLARIKNPRDTEAWEEFHDLYAPLLYRFARARGLSHADAEDIRSTCYETIIKQIQEFDYDAGKGKFKAWLKTLVSRRVVDMLRKRRDKAGGSQDVKQLADPEPGPDEVWDRAWRQQHLKYCVARVRADVPGQTFKAFELLMAEEPVPTICDRLGMTANQVYKAKARIIELVRVEMRAMYGEAEASPL